MPYIGALSLEQVHTDSLRAFVMAREAQGIRTKSINNALSAVRRILNLAARVWRDERGLTWGRSSIRYGTQSYPGHGLTDFGRISFHKAGSILM